jgi:hypothetical protein
VQKIASRIHPVLYILVCLPITGKAGAGVILPVAFIPEKGCQLQGLFSLK